MSKRAQHPQHPSHPVAGVPAHPTHPNPHFGAEPVKSLGRVLSTQLRNDIEGFAAKGAAIATSNPQVAAARALNSDGRFRWGFDVATGITQGMSLPGPGQTSWRTKIGPFSYGAGPGKRGVDASAGERGSNQALQGYDVGQALQHGITKAQEANKAAAIAAAPPNVAAGMLLAGGIAGSGSPPDVKAGVIQQTFADPGALQGATQVIKEKGGFFKKILAFFGL